MNKDRLNDMVQNVAKFNKCTTYSTNDAIVSIKNLSKNNNKIMNLKEIFEKIYNDEITKNDVIVVHQDGEDEEYDNYILNDGFDYWDTNGAVSLSFFSKEYEYSYKIITEEEYESLIEKKEKQERIAKLKKELKELEEN